MKTFSKRFAEAFNDEVIEGTIYRIDLDRVDVIPNGSTGIMRSLPLTGDRDKVQVGDRVRVMRVGGERVALVGDVALGFDNEEEVTVPEGGITPLDLEEALTDREAGGGYYVLKNADGQVGINRAPDPQFDLDVAGSIRTGGYFVGPHALQLAGAKLIAHFDGPDPLATDTKGEVNGHMGQIGTLTGTYDFRPGKFNKALHLFPGATLSYASATAIDITQPGTLSFWRRKEVGDTDTADGIWLSVGTAAPDYLALKNSADSLSLEFILNTTTLRMLLPADNEFHLYALTWNGITASLYIDGVRHPEYLDEGSTLQSGAYTAPTANPPTLLIGAEIHTLDDLTSVDHAMSAEEMVAVFESSAPVFAETSVWGFRSPNTLSYVDSEGLWAVSSAGNPAFGVSGVDGKAWGGLTLDSGDVLIGRGASYAKWDDSTGTFSFVADGSGLTNINGSNITTGTISAARIAASSITSDKISLNGFLAIGSAGGVYQGTGTAAAPTTGLKIFNSSGVGKLETYKSGVKQVTLDTDGALKAAAGAVLLDASGITIQGDYGPGVVEGSDIKAIKWAVPRYGNAAYTDNAATINGFQGADGHSYMSINQKGVNVHFSLTHGYQLPGVSGYIGMDTNTTTMRSSLYLNASEYIQLKTDENKQVAITGNIAPKYSTYVSGINADGQALIVNDNSANTGFQALMIIGSNFAGGVRKVKLWDRLEINGTLNVSGAVTTSSTLNVAGTISTTNGTSGATYYPIACTNVFDHTTGVGNAVTGSHQINLAGVGGIPTDAIAVAGRIGGNFATAGNNYYVSVRKWGETGTGIFACVCRSLDININHDDTFVVNTSGTTVSVNFEVVGAGCERAYLVVYGYWAKL